jgi:hypothetical protein
MDPTEFINVRKTIYSNAISCKLPNRRITVIKLDDGYGVEMRIADENPERIRSQHRVIKGKVAVSAWKISDEGAEILMRTIAEMRGYKIRRDYCKTKKQTT